MSRIVEKMLYLAIEECFNNVLDPGPELNDFRNLITSFLSKDTSLVKFSLGFDQ